MGSSSSKGKGKTEQHLNPSSKFPKAEGSSRPVETINGDVGRNDSIKKNEKALKVISVDLRVQETGISHHTKKFDLVKRGVLVTRRGQPFNISITFDREFDHNSDVLKFILETGENPKPGNDTIVYFTPESEKEHGGWKAVYDVENDEGTELMVWIRAPVECIVGEWKLSIECSLDSEHDWEREANVYEHKEKLYILFNPWCKDDTVYFPAEPMLEEYILNHSGVIFQGSEKKIIAKPWAFGQFDSGVLDACLYIMRKSFGLRTIPAMGDSVKVVRNIAKILNSDEGQGVVVPMWFVQNPDEGRSPTSWSGSVAILKQYVDSCKKSDNGLPQPVKYGQCFVFAGLFTTICRAIGIPCRCVTNYNSGRDNDASMTIDRNYELTENGLEEIFIFNHDFIWNFHVWNDVWMSRPDLPIPLDEYDWQALDTTPQLSSGGSQRCGPAPLQAIKEGITHCKYDTDFMFAEVNADVLHWLKISKADWSIFCVEESRVGHRISTKVPDGKPVDLNLIDSREEMEKLRQDVTDEYKHSEGSDMERILSQKAGKHKRPIHKCKMKDVKCEFKEKDSVPVGDSFEVTLVMRNYHHTEERTVHVTMISETVYYNGRRHAVVKRENFKKKLNPESSDGVIMKVSETDYINKLTEHAFMKEFILVNVLETEQVEVWVDDFVFERPYLRLQPEENVEKGKSFEVRITFMNPLNRPLTGCNVSVEGPGLYSNEHMASIKDIPARCEWTGIVTLLPVRSKKIPISATFHCKEIFDLKGSVVVDVEKPQEE